MTSRVKQARRIDGFCAECLRCFTGSPEACPECGAPEPDRGWDDIRTCSYPYLGKIVDDRYLLDCYLGGGASGRVYRARDIKLDRPFALKILDLTADGGSSTESSLRRFENEVEALSRIRNPHVINIYESYRLEGETPAMLTEYIEGVTLAEMLEDDQLLEVEAALTLIRQVANGLQEAHARGVIHRDLKPANIMVEQLPAAGSFARILDFGLVHLSDESGETRGFWGTPLYAAPEQCAPGPPITGATDIYSLGCVIFHCIAGEPPFSGSDPRVIMRAHVEQPPPRLSDVADQRVPEEVDTIVASMLEKEQEDRPDDMTEIVSVLEMPQRNSGVWNKSVVAESSEDLREPSETSEAIELDDAGAATDGTRIGVADTGAEPPRVAQLLESVDLEEKLTEFSGTVVATELDRTGDCAVLSDSESRVFIMSTKGESYFQELSAADSRISSLAPDISRGRVFAAEQNGAVLKWRLRSTGSRPSRELSVDDRLFSIALGGNGQQLFVGTESGRILRHDLRVGTQTEVCTLSSAVTSLHVARDRSHLLASTVEGAVYGIRFGGSGEDVVQLATFDQDVRALEFDPDASIAAAIGGSNQLRMFHLRSSYGGVTVSPDVENLRTIAVVPGGEILAVGVKEPEVRIWRIRRERIDNRLPETGKNDRSTAGRTRGFGRVDRD